MNAKALYQRIEQLEAENLELKKQLLATQKKIIELEQRLLAYENANTPSSKTKKKRPPREKSDRGLGAPVGHKKWEREQAEPTQTMEHEQDACPDCGHSLGKSVFIERRVIEDTPEPKPIEVTEHLIHHYICPCCGKKVVAPHALPKSCFGPNLQTHVTLLKYDDRLPLRKVVRTLERTFHIHLTDVAVLNMTKRAATKLLPEYKKLVQLVRASKVVYADETEIKVDGKPWWIWVFVGEHGTVYVIKPTRSKKVAQEILGPDYAGIVTSDGYSAYSKYKHRQRCWAHILREAKQLFFDHPSFDLFYKKLKGLFSEVKEIREKPPPLKERLALKAWLEQRMQELIDTLDSHMPFRGLATKLRNGTSAWFTCIEHLFVEPTNNKAERALRELIVQRKIIGGLRSENGADTMSIINTMLATWQAQGLPLFQTLKNTLNH